MNLITLNLLCGNTGGSLVFNHKNYQTITRVDAYYLALELLAYAEN